ncbi:MAG: hypothetical protein MJY42_00760 [Bacteroidales bacterium]|nr:hypothetical protein [Bacteroidales bacterium]
MKRKLSSILMLLLAISCGRRGENTEIQIEEPVPESQEQEYTEIDREQLFVDFLFECPFLWRRHRTVWRDSSMNTKRTALWQGL